MSENTAAVETPAAPVKKAAPAKKTVKKVAKKAAAVVKKVAAAKPAKAAKKAAGKKVVTRAAGPKSEFLSVNEARILTSLAKGDKTRNEIKVDSGMQKGFSAVMGTVTKEIQPTTLMGRSLIKLSGGDESTRGTYSITAAGKKLLEKHVKALAAVPAE